jgi:microcystin degradation protein MlrC
MRPKRLFSAALVHETCGFSPIPTAMSDFEGGLFFDPGRGPPTKEQARCLELGLRRVALARGHIVVDSLHAAASPSAPPRAAVYEMLRDRILRDLERALPLDGVLLFLHGAQMAQGYEDCEGDLLMRAREIVGARVAIGVELDLHGNISERMVDHADVMAMCLEYPHTDFAARATHVLDILEATLDRELAPVSAFVPVPMLGIFHTTRDPMRSFVDRARALECRDGVLSVSIQHGFPSSDSSRTGAGILVIADRDRACAQAVALALAREFFALREEIRAPRLGIDEAIDAALAFPRGPVIVADTSDNPGGGAAGDSTYLLRRLIERQVPDVAVGAMWDPQALEFAMKAGVGARLPLRIGGKVGALSGEPLDLDVEVRAVCEDLVGFAFGERAYLGPHIALEAGNVVIVLSRRREQTHSPQVFTQLGIDLKSKRIVVVKSAQHFHALFAPIAAAILYASPPGTVTTDYSIVPHRRLRRPIWPLDEPPFAFEGREWTH